MEDARKSFDQKTNGNVMRLVENYRLILKLSHIPAQEDIADHERLQMEAATANIVTAIECYCCDA